MITQCKNCAGQLVFDPAKQMLVCDHCGSEFKPEEFDVSEKIPLWEQKAESMNDVYGTDSKEFMDCYVYTCHTCGGEVIINGSEASTKCIYCGSSTVVFNRISKHKRPKYIIPFKISKEDAVESIRQRFKRVCSFQKTSSILRLKMCEESTFLTGSSTAITKRPLSSAVSSEAANIPGQFTMEEQDA